MVYYIFSPFLTITRFSDSFFQVRLISFNTTADCCFVCNEDLGFGI